MKLGYYQLFVRYPNGAVYEGLYSERKEELQVICKLCNQKYASKGKEYYVNKTVY